jgi:Tetracyclin repressor-like, C-terminal domain
MAPAIEHHRDDALDDRVERAAGVAGGHSVETLDHGDERERGQVWIGEADLTTGDTAKAAKMLWTSLHGVIHLRFAGHLPDEDEARLLYAYSVTTLVEALLRD